MGVKSFLEDWKPKKDKKELQELLGNELPALEAFYFSKGHKEREIVDEIYSKMSSPKFPKCLKKLMKEQELDAGVATIIADFLERKGSELPEELVTLYAELVDKLLKDSVKKLSKKVGIEPDVAKDVLVVVPGDEYINDRFVGIFVGRVCRKLYLLARETGLNLKETKQLKKLFKFLFKDELLNDVAVAILLEKKEFMKNFNDKQVEIWNALTNFALDTLNGLEKEDLRNYLVTFAERRMRDYEKNRDAARRVQLTQLADDTYSRIAKVVSKLQEKEKYAKFL